MLFLLPEGLSPAVNLGTNAFMFIQIVNMTPDAPNQTAPSLTSAAEARLLLSPPGQVFSHHPCGSAQAAQPTCCMHQCTWLTPVCVFAAAQAAKAANVCRFFPECKNVDCKFYHPKVRQNILFYFANKSIRHKKNFWIKSSEFCQQACRFAAMCKRASCTFYHPTTSVPPRHALKWTKAQSRWTQLYAWVQLSVHVSFEAWGSH